MRSRQFEIENNNRDIEGEYHKGASNLNPGKALPENKHIPDKGVNKPNVPNQSHKAGSFVLHCDCLEGEAEGVKCCSQSHHCHLLPAISKHPYRVSNEDCLDRQDRTENKYAKESVG